MVSTHRSVCPVFSRMKPNKIIKSNAKRILKRNVCFPLFCGAEEDRTPDPLLAKQVLSQLS